MEIKEILNQSKQLNNKVVEISGWIRFKRVSKKNIFLTLFDGSNIDGIQIVVKEDNKEFVNIKKITLFSALKITGNVLLRNNQPEIILQTLKEIYLANDDYSLGKKEHGLEFLREVLHIRPRTKLFQAVMKIRSNLSFAVHNFFNNHHFLYLNSPIITSNDAEGAGELFYLTTKQSKSIFSSEVSLTVSGQLHAEAFAQAFKNVYTFGPTFRAENSNTPRHASEFWMIEPEMVFQDYHKAMDLGEDLLKFLIKEIIDSSYEELVFLQNYFKNNLLKELKTILDKKFIRISYIKAIEILQNAKNNGVKFEDSNIKFGIDLKTEHEKYLSSQYAKGPIYIFDYPSEIKAFYMYLNDDGKTVRGFDLLVPNIGEIIGGSQREDRYDLLMSIVKKQKINLSQINWYVEMRKYGYGKSSGFGIGFERLVMLFTGLENIRDVIPFPRTPGKVDY